MLSIHFNVSINNMAVGIFTLYVLLQSCFVKKSFKYSQKFMKEIKNKKKCVLNGIMET